MFKLLARACIVAIALWSTSIDPVYAQTISSNWTPDTRSGLTVLFKVSCNPVINSGSGPGSVQEYDAYFENSGSQPISFQVQITPPGQGAQPYAWQSVPNSLGTLPPGQPYGGASNGYAWSFSNLPCNSVNVDSLNVFIQVNPGSGTTSGASNPETHTIPCSPAPGQSCPPSSQGPYVPSSTTVQPGGIRGEQTPPSQGTTIAQTFGNVANIINSYNSRMAAEHQEELQNAASNSALASQIEDQLKNAIENPALRTRGLAANCGDSSAGAQFAPYDGPSSIAGALSNCKGVDVILAIRSSAVRANEPRTMYGLGGDVEQTFVWLTAGSMLPEVSPGLRARIELGVAKGLWSGVSGLAINAPYVAEEFLPIAAAVYPAFSSDAGFRALCDDFCTRQLTDYYPNGSCNDISRQLGLGWDQITGCNGKGIDSNTVDEWLLPPSPQQISESLKRPPGEPPLGFVKDPSENAGIYDWHRADAYLAIVVSTLWSPTPAQLARLIAGYSAGGTVTILAGPTKTIVCGQQALRTTYAYGGGRWVRTDTNLRHKHVTITYHAPSSEPMPDDVTAFISGYCGTLPSTPY